MALLDPPIVALQKQIEAQTRRAERWKGLCGHLLSGMSSVFAQYEIEIDGRATPTIDTGGLYRCCVEGLREVIASECAQERFTCPTCEQVSVLEKNVWKAKGEAA